MRKHVGAALAITAALAVAVAGGAAGAAPGHPRELVPHITCHSGDIAMAGAAAAAGVVYTLEVKTDYGPAQVEQIVPAGVDPQTVRLNARVNAGKSGGSAVLWVAPTDRRNERTKVEAVPYGDPCLLP